MTRPSASATLYGDKAELLREIQREMADEKGFEPGNAEVIAELMAYYNKHER
ncbi:hypothetical protein [Halobacterium sp. KA-6]|uniref:hypothetical protein n=1 Tax=Halobacterium sp. KA-6 TaxID=2896368 RepID=UPI001E53DC5D|nr:hypothetical protein [Halobacterium sp. KA-6]MCD2202748.1 hypothetical protein [Halobacterium sp. KA-6]